MRFVKLDKNCGFALANNKGFARADNQSKYVAFLNNDVLVREDWLGNAVRVLESSPSTGMIGCNQFGANGFRFYGAYTDRLGFTCFRSAQEFRVQEVSWWGGAALVIRRDLFERLGGFTRLFSSSLPKWTFVGEYSLLDTGWFKSQTVLLCTKSLHHHII